MEIKVTTKNKVYSYSELEISIIMWGMYVLGFLTGMLVMSIIL